MALQELGSERSSLHAFDTLSNYSLIIGHNLRTDLVALHMSRLSALRGYWSKMHRTTIAPTSFSGTIIPCIWRYSWPSHGTTYQSVRDRDSLV